MYAWYQRRRREFMGLAVVGAAGAVAAYCAYQWYWHKPAPAAVGTLNDELSPSEKRQDESVTSVGHGMSSVAKMDPVADLEERMRTHLHDLQAIGDRTLLPQLQARLFEKLKTLVDVDSVLVQLRKLRAGTTQLEQERKVHLWNEVCRRCFLLHLATTWMLPALDLLTHVHVTIVGRHLYLESITRDGSLEARWRVRFPASPSKSPLGASDDAPRLPPMSLSQQNALFSYTEFFVNEGIHELLPRLRHAVESQLCDVDVKKPIPLATVWQLLSGMHAAVEAQVQPFEWSSYLVPPLILAPISPQGIANLSIDAQASPSSLLLHSSEPRCMLPACYLPGGISDPMEVEVITEMLLEIREVIRTQRFAAALKAAVMCTADLVSGYLHTSFSSRAPSGMDAVAELEFPLATIVPWVSQASNALMRDSDCMRDAISDLEDIQQMYVTVYAKGPRAR